MSFLYVNLKRICTVILNYIPLKNLLAVLIGQTCELSYRFGKNIKPVRIMVAAVRFGISCIDTVFVSVEASVKSLYSLAAVHILVFAYCSISKKNLSHSCSPPFSVRWSAISTTDKNPIFSPIANNEWSLTL